MSRVSRLTPLGWRMTIHLLAADSYVRHRRLVLQRSHESPGQTLTAISSSARSMNRSAV